MIRHATGSLALFADLLRYELLGQGYGLYVDCDVFCIRPIEDKAYILGWEYSYSLNNAVLKLPIESPTLADLRRLKDTQHFVPPWLRKKRRKWWRVGTKSLNRLPLKTTGPDALTYYAMQNREERYASPIDRFYPLHDAHCVLLYDPGIKLEHILTPRTDAIHLNTRGHDKDWAVNEGSAMWELLNSVRCPDSV
jgi:hypothetical protein